MSTTILVTGPTGTIGSQVVAHLAKKQDVTIRAGVRDAAKGKDKLPAGVVPVDFDYDKPETLGAACQGVDKVFLLTPFAPNQVEIGNRLVDAAKAAGVKHIVKLSALGADQEPGIQLGRWHRAIEKHVEASGIAWTFLRPNNFMDNFAGYYPPDKEGAIYLPWGNGACSFIDARDVGAVAAACLTSSGHEGKAYVLTGPDAFTIARAAATLSEVTGRTIKYVDVPEAAAKKAMLDMGMPAWMVDGMMELHAVDKAGYAATVTDDVKKITGTAARSFRDYARDNVAKWSV
jgi:uncharacterized protein YbjT (DUF2867 family)